MKLYLASAIGRGSTELGAFDAALFGAGVANLNLVRLSSVIPPGSDIIQVERCPFEQNGRWGDRLYAVYAEQRTTTPGEQVWAGVGWCQDRETGQGLFVEHHGDREQPVRDQITASLTDLQAIRGLDLGPIHKCVVGAMCVGTPTCRARHLRLRNRVLAYHATVRRPPSPADATMIPLTRLRHAPGVSARLRPYADRPQGRDADLR